MPDLLSHVLVAFAVFRLASLRVRWLSTPYVTAAMAGAMLPDVSKVGLVVDSGDVAAVLGVPFDWFVIHTLGGVLVLAALGAIWVAPAHRRRAFGVVVAGAGTHLFLDALLMKPSGHSYAALWPLTAARLPTPGLYRSTDVWPTLTALLLAVAAWAVWRRRSRASDKA